MAKCFGCGNDGDTREVFIGRARGYEELCIDCMIKFFKIEKRN